MSKTKSVKPIPVPAKGTFLKPGIKTETFLHSIGQDAETVGVTSAGADPNEALSPIAVSEKPVKTKEEKEKPEKNPAVPKASKNEPAKLKKEADDRFPKGRKNTILLPNLTTEDYLDFHTCIAAYAGTKRAAYRRMIDLFMADVKKTIPEEDFDLLRRMEERKLLAKIKKQKGE